MATFTGALTLADLKTRLEPDNSKVATIIEVLKRADDMYLDVPFMEGNLLTGHRAIIRAGLPTPTWRMLNQGVSATKSTTAPVEFPCGMLEDRSEIDKDLAELGGDVSGARWSEAEAHLMGMANAFCDTLIYGDPTATPSTDIPKFPGLAAYYKDDTTGNTKDNIIDAGGTDSDNTSIWFITWGSQTIHGIYPKGLPAGLQHEDLGLGDAFDSNNRRFRAYMDRYEWKCGLAVKDWRAAVRIANIKTGTLISTVANQQALINYMIQAVHKNKCKNMGKSAFYANATTLTALDLGMRADVKAGGGLTYENVDGKQVMHFRGFPIRQSDSIIDAEATVS